MSDLKRKAIEGNPIVTFDKNGFPLSAEQRAKLEPIPPLQTSGQGGGGGTSFSWTTDVHNVNLAAGGPGYVNSTLINGEAHCRSLGNLPPAYIPGPDPLIAVSALHLDAGKPPLGMIPREALELEAQAFAYGAKKYGRNNYQNGMEWTKLIDSVLRHVNAFSGKEDIDPESGLNHLAHARASLAMLVYHLQHHPSKDDR